MKNNNSHSKFYKNVNIIFGKSILCMFLAFLFTSANAQNVGRINDGFYAISTSGEKLSPAYDFIQFAEYGFQVASKNGKFGYLDKYGNIAIPFIYDVAYPFSGNFSLVGRAGKYYHINKTNKLLDSMNWPKAPLVYQAHFLIINENENKVFYEDGSELLRSTGQLILAEKGGIIEWNSQKDSLFQYASPNGNRMLKRINSLSTVGEPIITNQGYLCISQIKAGKKTSSVYDQYGKQLVSFDAGSIDLNLIQVVWDDFVYLPNGNPVLRPHQLGQETHFPMSELWMKGQNQLSPLTFQLCDKYANDHMIMLKYADKWLPFDGREIKGNFLFDDVVPGDEHLTPVKMGQKWYLLDHRQDSLIPLPYLQIHPIGMNKGRFFASMTEDGNLNDARWSFISYHTQTATKEQYQVPLLPEENSLYNYQIRYNWSHQLNQVIKDGKRVLINNRGEEVWTDSVKNSMTIEDFFKVNFAFEFGNFKELAKKNNYPKNQISIFLKPISSGIYVQLTNTKKEEELVDIQDGFLQAVLEMKDIDGTWRKIGFLDPSWCGNSYYIGYFPSKKEASTTIHLPKGDQQITVRVVLNEHNNNRIVSNELKVNTNGARLWVDKYCGGYGCTTKD